MSYITEWCETPDRRRPGVAYTDACVLYDRDAGIITQTNRDPENNIYLMIQRPLMEPVLSKAVEDTRRFIAQTFWANVKVYKCMQAAQALAKRGENIDRAFIGISPGGVGQSLYTAWLAAQYGHLHAYVDPNIFFHDDELRKQVEQFVGCIILTGQEAPECGKRFREDLYKKTMSADGVCERA